MAEYNNFNRIAIFPVKEKTSAKSPDFTGNVNLAGINFRVSLWKTEAKSGLKYLSGLIEKADEERSAPAKEGAEVEDIPF